MRHGRDHRKLGRTSSHRRAMLRNLVSSLFVSASGRIKTTVEKAKEARRVAEKMITLGKRESVHARRIAARTIADRTIIKKLFDDIAPKFAGRNGGYTRVLRVGPRPGDNAEMALLELVGIAEEARKAKAAAAKDEKAKGEKKPKGAEDAEKATADKAAQAEAREKRRAEKKAQQASRATTKGKAKSAAKSPSKGQRGS